MPEAFLICVDVETAGPIPGEYAMISIGACPVHDISETFYVELCPDRDKVVAEALAISGLDMDQLRANGVEPADAMRKFANWVLKVTPEGALPILVAFNAPFDWMFIHDYFIRYIGENPFGHSALDIKAFYMGQTGSGWLETSMRHISAHFLEERRLTHNALRDAQDQAEIFQKILEMNPKFHVGD